MHILITGGAGFIGFHTARYFHSLGNKVTILDDLSRSGSALNLKILRSEIPAIEFIKVDVASKENLFKVLENLSFDVIIHLAAQTAVTTSLIDPRSDFESNSIGSLNILEWARIQNVCPFLIYSSTNKVYGSLQGATLIEEESRYSLITER